VKHDRKPDNLDEIAKDIGADLRKRRSGRFAVDLPNGDRLHLEVLEGEPQRSSTGAGFETWIVTIRWPDEQEVTEIVPRERFLRDLALILRASTKVKKPVPTVEL
jgi:hypothetical protein